ncbi:hypothetical protein LSPCS325_29230 [Lysinibacillus sp. CTST325]
MSKTKIKMQEQIDALLTALNTFDIPVFEDDLAEDEETQFKKKNYHFFVYETGDMNKNDDNKSISQDVVIYYYSENRDDIDERTIDIITELSNLPRIVGVDGLKIFGENINVELISCYSDISVGGIYHKWSSDYYYLEGSFVRGIDNELYINYNRQDKKDYDYWESEWNSTGPPHWWPKPYYRAQPITGEVWPNFWKQVTSETHLEARTTTEMQRQSTFDGWDFDTVWTIDEGRGYPRFKLKITQIKCIRRPIPNYRWKTVD